MDDKIEENVDESVEDQEISHWSLHYMIKGIFRSAVHAASRIARRKMKGYMVTIPETKAFYNACEWLLAEEEKRNGKGSKNYDLYVDMRDIILCMAESQDAYRNLFADFTHKFVNEVATQKVYTMDDKFLRWE